MRVGSLVVTAAFALGCNAILGIEEARLGDASVGVAGQGGSGGSAGTAGSAGSGGEGGGCSLMAPDPCNQCLAQRCCDEYDACAADSDCKAALNDYNTCVGIDFTNDAGGTCDETLVGVSGNPRRSALATCAFQTAPPGGCADVCPSKPIGGSICVDYCACVQVACPDKSFEGADCMAVCGAFTEPQLTCRPYHCGLAKSAKMNNNESGRLTHCGHTFGEALCP
jgi:hypothetical protein